MKTRPLVGISSCLLGQKVRYDGGHKLDSYLANVLGKYVDFFPVCPESECGMSIPREPMHLELSDGRISLVTLKTKKDMTSQMETWIKDKLSELESKVLCGFIFKSKSPSSGLHRVKIYKPDGTMAKVGSGLFAQAFTEKFSNIPVEDEARLNDSGIRENFISRIFIMHRWNNLVSEPKSLKNIIEFHTNHKYLLMSHCPKSLKELGDFLAKAKSSSIDAVYTEYFQSFMNSLSKLSTVNKNTNVLQHIMGYFKNELTSDEKMELQEIISSYHSKLVPLVIPVTLINHYVRKYNQPYLKTQIYLNPHPLELMLRNHV